MEFKLNESQACGSQHGKDHQLLERRADIGVKGVIDLMGKPGFYFLRRFRLKDA